MKDLVPAFIAAFAIQQFIEIIDAVGKATRGKSLPIRPKTAVYRLTATIIGTIASWIIDLKLLPAPSEPSVVAQILTAVLSGLFIGAGTDGFNSLLKLFEYKKDSVHAETNVADVLMKHSQAK